MDSDVTVEPSEIGSTASRLLAEGASGDVLTPQDGQADLESIPTYLHLHLPSILLIYPLFSLH